MKDFRRQTSFYAVDIQGDETAEVAVDIVSGIYGIVKDEVTRSRTFDDYDEPDRLKAQMVMQFEEEFSIPIPDDEAETLTSVGAFIDYIKASQQL